MSSEQEVYWLVEIMLENEPLVISHRPLTLEGTVCEALLLDLDVEFRSFPDTPGIGGSTGLSVATLKLSRSGTRAASLIESLRRGILQGTRCRVGLFFDDPAKQEESSWSDVVWMGWFLVSDGTEDTTSFTLNLVDPVRARFARMACRPLSEPLPGIPSSVMSGFSAIPVVFGAVDRLELVPYVAEPATFLDRDVAPDDSTIGVVDLSGLPDAGFVQIGYEVLFYPDKDAEANALGTATSPVIRTKPGFHRCGCPVFMVPDRGFTYLVADHACHAVTRVFTDKTLLSPDDYDVMTEELDGREVTIVTVGRLPVVKANAAGVASLDISPGTRRGAWAVDPTTTAFDPYRILDMEGWSSAARLDRNHRLLKINCTGSVDNGETRFGSFERVRLCVCFMSNRRWSPTTPVFMRLKKEADETERALRRPMPSEFSGNAAAHSHLDTIDFTVSDSRPLFSSPGNTLVTRFDEVEGEEDLGDENFLWRDSHMAKDDDFSTGTLNFSGASVTGGKKPLRFRLHRISLNSDAARIHRINLCAQLDTAGTAAKYVQLGALINGKYHGTAPFWVTSVAKRYVFSIDCGTIEITPSDLTSKGTYFSIEVPGGGLVQALELWLELEYTLEFPGKKSSVSLSRKGNVQAAAELATSVPAASRWQEFDVTEFVKSRGGWAFFQGATPISVEIEFVSQDDEAQIYLQELRFVVEYRPPDTEEVQPQLFASVEGMMNDYGELMTNPAEIVRTLLTDERFMAIDVSLLDDESFMDAGDWCALQGFEFSRVLTKPARYGSLLHEALEESGIALVGSGEKIKAMVVADRRVSEPMDFVASRSNTLDEQIALDCGSDGEIINLVRLWYGAEGKRHVLQLENRPLRNRLGDRVKDWQMMWHSAESAGLTLIGAMLLNRSAGNTMSLSVTQPLTASRLEPVDRVEAALPLLMALTERGKVARVKLGSFASWRFMLELPSRGIRCWEYDEQTFIQHMASNLEKEIVIQGEVVARLGFLGNLHIKGEFIAFSPLDEYCDEPVSYDAINQRILFSYMMPEGGYRCCAAIDRNGDVYVKGSVAERFIPEGAGINGCYESNVSFFAISIDGETVLVCYDVLKEELSVKGEIAERVEV